MHHKEFMWKPTTAWAHASNSKDVPWLSQEGASKSPSKETYKYKIKNIKYKNIHIKYNIKKGQKKKTLQGNNMGVENLSLPYKVFKKGFIRRKKNLDFNTSKTKVSCSNKSCSDNPTSSYSEPPQGVWELYHLCLWIHLIRKISIQHFVCIVCAAIPCQILGTRPTQHLNRTA